jgi:two-component system response regulator YesN
VITVKIKWDVRFDQKAIIASISKIAEYFNDDKLFDPAYIIIGFSSSDHIIMIIKEHFDTLTSTLNNPFIIKLRAYFNDFGGIPISVSIGIGPTENNMTNLPSSYHLSCKANQLRFYLGMGEVFYYKDAISSNLLVDSNIYTDFENAIKSDDKYEAFAIIMKVFNSARNATCDDVNYIKNVFFTIIITFFRIAGEKKLIDENLNSHKEYIWDQIYKIETITELLDYTLSFHKSYFLRIEVKYSTQSKNVHVVIKYIRNNFCSPDISIKSISEHTFLSQGYLCSIFKKEQGKTINEFITELRIEKAKELMQNKVLRLYEIASHIGFQNVNYFSMVFRRYTGCSPSEYRSKWLI